MCSKRRHSAFRRLIAAALVMMIAFQCMIQTTVPSASAAGGEMVIITGTTVNVRSSATQANNVIGSVGCGTQLQYISQAKDGSGNTWYKVQYKPGSTGWVISTYSLKCDASATGKTLVDALSKSYGSIGLQVALIDDGTVTETFNYGYATKGSKKMTDDVKIRIASVSKVFIGMNAMKMQEEGVLNYKSNIGAYWGATLPKKVTLQNLLSHTSTLGDLSAQSTREATLNQLTSSSSYTSGTPGTSSVWRYNNFGAGVAGSTLEVASKTLLDTYAHSRFLDPLGIDASFFSGNVKSQNLATLYYNGGSVARSVDAQKSYKGNSTPGANTTSFAGGLTISAKDCAKLIAILANDGAYAGKQYLQPSSVAAMEEHLFTESEYGGSFSQCVPLRYKANLYGQKELYYHTGNAYGVLALASYNPGTRDGVVVISTGASQTRDQQGVYAVCSTITEAMYKYMDSAPKNPATAIALDRGSASLKLGGKLTLNTTLTPKDSDTAVVWTSSNNAVATVSDNGVVNAVDFGTAVITATAGKVKATCTVSIVPDIPISMTGSSIRISDPYGIRFRVTVDKTGDFSKACISEYGTIMIPTANLGGQSLNLSTRSVLRIPCKSLLTSTKKELTYTGVLIHIPESYFGTDIIARGYINYIDAEGKTHTIYSDAVTRSFDSVAQASYDSYSSILFPNAAQKAALEKLKSFLKLEDKPEVSDTDTTTAATETEPSETTTTAPSAVPSALTSDADAASQQDDVLPSE